MSSSVWARRTRRDRICAKLSPGLTLDPAMQSGFRAHPMNNWAYLGLRAFASVSDGNSKKCFL